MKIRRAVLVIHGFAGGTYDIEYLANYLQINRFDVFAFTLPGHDGVFRFASREDWIRASCDMMDMLIRNGYSTIYIVGHSMGGVIASYLASKYSSVKKLVLVSAAFRYLVFKDGEIDVGKSLLKSGHIIKNYSTNEVFNRILKMPPKAISEFRSLVSDNESVLGSINIPTLIVQGTCDDLVDSSTANYIYNNLSSSDKSIVMVDGVNHDVFRSDKCEQVSKQILDFLK